MPSSQQYILSHVRAAWIKGFQHLIPVRYGFKEPPLIDEYYDIAPPGVAQWQEWASKWCNVGAVLGDGMVILDPDSRHAVAWLRAMMRQEPALMNTLTIISASGKPHPVYRIDYVWDGKRNIAYPSGRMFLQVKTGRSYMLIPPSRIFEYGARYRYLDEHAPIAYLPKEKLEWLVQEAEHELEVLQYQRYGVLDLDHRADVIDMALRIAGVKGYRGLEHNFFCPFHDDGKHPDMRAYRTTSGQYVLFDFHGKGRPTYKIGDLWFHLITGKDPDCLRENPGMYEMWALRAYYDLGLLGQVWVPRDVPIRLRRAVEGVILLAYLRQYVDLERDNSMFPLHYRFFSEWLGNVPLDTVRRWKREMEQEGFLEVAWKRKRKGWLYRLGPRLLGVIPAPVVPIIDTAEIIEGAARQ